MLKIIASKNSTSPDSEWIKLEVLENCWLDDFMIIDETYDAHSHKSNKNRHSFIFPQHEVFKGEILYLNTGNGTNDDPATSRKLGEDYFDYYWGLGTPVWNSVGDVATVLKIFKVDSKNV